MKKRIEKTFQFEEMIISEELNTEITTSRLDLKITPVNPSQEVLRKVIG